MNREFYTHKIKITHMENKTEQKKQEQRRITAFAMLPEEMEGLKQISDEVPGKYSRAIDNLLHGIRNRMVKIPVLQEPIEDEGGAT